MNLTTIIITKNEEKNIADCLDSVKFSDEIIVVDNNSTDLTPEIAKKFGAKVIREKFESFSAQREAGLKAAKSDWVLYLDADERISEKLKENILETIKDNNTKEVYKIKRKNFYFYKYEWKFYDDLERLFKKDALKSWYGEIHESPNFIGEVGSLNGFIIHYTHNDLTSMLNKTIKWSDTEAKLRIEANHPNMGWWRFPRVMVPTFFNYYVRQKGYKLGTAGLIESIFQSYSMFITYAKLWEMQQKKS